MHNIKTRLANQRVGDSRCFSFKPQIRQPPRRPFRREHLSLFAPPHPLPSSIVACIRHNGRRIRCFSLPDPDPPECCLPDFHIRRCFRIRSCLRHLHQQAVGYLEPRPSMEGHQVPIPRRC